MVLLCKFLFITIKRFIQRLHRQVFLWTSGIVPLLLLYFVIFRSASQHDPFYLPFCNPSDGVCHEKPDVASPRTEYSAMSKKQYDQWWRFNDELKQRAKEYALNRVISTSVQQLRPLILLGDSITESWLGTSGGKPKNRTEGVPQVLESKLSSSNGFDPLVLAISGDQTQHLLWRLQNGQLLSEFADDPTSIFGILVGTNNLGSGELPGPTARGILTVVEYLLNHTSQDNHILVFQVLPRGDGKTLLPKLCPPRCHIDGSPYTSFLPPIQRVNQLVEEGMGPLRKAYTTRTTSGRLTFMDCGSEFLNDEKSDSMEEVKTSLMPDLLHPNAQGHELLAKCIRQFADKGR
jgi:lysophospholipase L1-like esterase